MKESIGSRVGRLISGSVHALIDADPPRAQAMLEHLITFLRATLHGSRALSHPLRDEFAGAGRDRT